MKKHLIHLFVLGIILFSAIVMHSCKKSGNAATVSGTVIDESSNPIAGATVQVGSGKTTTGSDGSFSVPGVPAGSTFLVTVKAQGYFPGYRNVENVNGASVTTQLMLLSQPAAVTLTGGNGTIVANNTKITAMANAFKTANGQVYTGDVLVYTRYVDGGNLDKASRTMPGGDFEAIDNTGTTGLLRTYGFTAAMFTDGNGNALTPVTGMVNTGVALGTGVTEPIADGGTAWAFNPTAGQWNNAGQLTNNAGQYDLPCITIFQNMDKFIKFGYLTGRVLDCNGNPESGMEVVASNQWDEYIAYTNSRGVYRMRAEAQPGGGTGGFTVSSGSGSVSASWPTPGGTVQVADINDASNCNGGGGGGGGTITYTPRTVNFDTACTFGSVARGTLNWTGRGGSGTVTLSNFYNCQGNLAQVTVPLQADSFGNFTGSSIVGTMNLQVSIINGFASSALWSTQHLAGDFIGSYNFTCSNSTYLGGDDFSFR